MSLLLFFNSSAATLFTAGDALLVAAAPAMLPTAQVRTVQPMADGWVTSGIPAGLATLQTGGLFSSSGKLRPTDVPTPVALPAALGGRPLTAAQVLRTAAPVIGLPTPAAPLRPGDSLGQQSLPGLSSMLLPLAVPGSLGSPAGAGSLAFVFQPAGQAGSLQVLASRITPADSLLTLLRTTGRDQGSMGSLARSLGQPTPHTDIGPQDDQSGSGLGTPLSPLAVQTRPAALGVALDGAALQPADLGGPVGQGLGAAALQMLDALNRLGVPAPHDAPRLLESLSTLLTIYFVVSDMLSVQSSALAAGLPGPQDSLRTRETITLRLVVLLAARDALTLGARVTGLLGMTAADTGLLHEAPTLVGGPAAFDSLNVDPDALFFVIGSGSVPFAFLVVVPNPQAPHISAYLQG